MYRTTFSVKALNTAILFIAFVTIGIVACQGQGFLVPDDEIGDLEIVEVKQLPVIDPSCGPRFGIVIANQSNRCVENFHVTAIGSLGHAMPHSPRVTVIAKHIPANGALQVEVALPIETLAMGNRGGLIIGLQHLTVHIDSWDEFFECDEFNNRKCFPLDSLPIETIEAVAVETTMEIAPAAATLETTVQPNAGIPANVAPQAGKIGPPAPANAAVNPQDPLRSAIEQITPNANILSQ
ncbi:putative transmembrane protein [Rhodopirellula islandica]|uniref:Transmembrane protein n=1 Tax=Rhodopirellula islandica TaxID=595434 RepID=A0A0J1BML4_RHOIS|nr:hypothetical protein [Rhodopirellula islandica]KLU07698.1 putative transmembrane protein [Rhodopirellula islandica]